MGYNLQDNFNVYSGNNLVCRNSTAVTYASVSWTAGSSYSLKKASIYMLQQGVVPSGYTVYVQIWSASGTAPNTLLGTSISIDPSTIGTGAFYDFIFSTPVALTSGTVYCMVFAGTFPISSTNYVKIGYNPSGTGTIETSSDGTTWVVNANGNLYMSTYSYTASNYTDSLTIGTQQGAASFATRTSTTLSSTLGIQDGLSLLGGKSTIDSLTLGLQQGFSDLLISVAFNPNIIIGMLEGLTSAYDKILTDIDYYRAYLNDVTSINAGTLQHPPSVPNIETSDTTYFRKYLNDPAS